MSSHSSLGHSLLISPCFYLRRRSSTSPNGNVCLSVVKLKYFLSTRFHTFLKPPLKVCKELAKSLHSHPITKHAKWLHAGPWKCMHFHAFPWNSVWAAHKNFAVLIFDSTDIKPSDYLVHHLTHGPHCPCFWWSVRGWLIVWSLCLCGGLQDFSVPSSSLGLIGSN